MKLRDLPLGPFQLFLAAARDDDRVAALLELFAELETDSIRATRDENRISFQFHVLAPARGLGTPYRRLSGCS
jgi:hypothetical protein